METRMLVIALASVSGFACLFAGATLISSAFLRRRAAMAAQGDRFTLAGLASWRLRNGFVFLLPFSRALLKRNRIKKLAEEITVLCSKRGWTTTPESALSNIVAIVLVFALLVGLVLGNILGALACIACATALLLTLLGNERDKRNESIREEIPDALESMGACFSSGFTLLQTFSQVGREIKGPLGETFRRCAHILETGGTAEDALFELKEGSCAEELAFVAVALDVQHQSGGTIRQVLASANEAVKGSLSLRRSLRVQTAQARLSARVVVLMPFVLVAAFSLVSPDFLKPFFSSAFGYGLLALVIVMQAAGILLVRRALSVEGIS